MKNIRSISMAALSIMLLLSTTASHGMWKSIVNKGSNLVAAVKAHPYITCAAVIAVPVIVAVGYAAYKAVANKAKDKAIIANFAQTITSKLKAIDDIRNGRIVKSQLISKDLRSTLEKDLEQLSQSPTNQAIKDAVKKLLRAISTFDAQPDWQQVDVDQVNEAAQEMEKYGLKFDKIAQAEQAKQELISDFENIKVSKIAAGQGVQTLMSEFEEIK